MDKAVEEEIASLRRYCGDELADAALAKLPPNPTMKDLADCLRTYTMWQQSYLDQLAAKVESFTRR